MPSTAARTLSSVTSCCVQGGSRATLSAGHSIPLLGLGAWQVSRDRNQEVVTAAIEAGVRHFDCAPIYGNEDQVGHALHRALRDGRVSRSDLFITSKLWGAADIVVRAAKLAAEPTTSKHEFTVLTTPRGPAGETTGLSTITAAIRGACVRSLRALRIDQLDLYLMHWPPADDDMLILAWRAMEMLVADGLVKSIGVANYSRRRLQLLIDRAGDAANQDKSPENSLVSSVPMAPAVNQVEAHPGFRNDALIAFCKARGVHVTAYCPLGGAPSRTVKASSGGLLSSPRVVESASRLRCTPAQALLLWGVWRGCSVIPKSEHPVRVRENTATLITPPGAKDRMRVTAGKSCHNATSEGNQPYGTPAAEESRLSAIIQEALVKLDDLQPQTRSVLGENFVGGGKLGSSRFASLAALWEDEVGSTT